MNLAPFLAAAQTYRDAAKAALTARLAERAIDAEQRAAHGFAWVATTVAALEAVAGWLDANAGGTALDRQVATLIFAESIAQLTGGLPMGQNEIFRPADLGLSGAAASLASAAEALLGADLAAARAAVAVALADGQTPSESLHDAELDAIREQYRRFTDSEILPHAHKWHLANDLIPDATVAAMAALGTFGVCIPEAFGGLGLSKLVMCLVTEELSRGWIGAGSIQANMRRRRVKARGISSCVTCSRSSFNCLRPSLKPCCSASSSARSSASCLTTAEGSRRCSKPRHTSHWPPTACASTSLPSGDSQPRLSMSWLPQGWKGFFASCSSRRSTLMSQLAGRR